MSFKELTILKREYRSTRDNVIQDFLVPVLNKSTLYKRAVGYFSSQILIELTKGLSGFIKSGGKMYLIASPNLSAEDIAEIQKGYSLKQMIEEKIFESIIDPVDDISRERLSWIAYMISHGNLEIKLAYMKNNVGIYHEKIGVFYDHNGNKIAYSGSLNDTYSAVHRNYESFDVFVSWKPGEFDRVLDKEVSFDALWNDLDSSMMVLDFPEASKRKLLNYTKDGPPNFAIDKPILKKLIEGEPNLPSEVKLYDYQIEAIKQWRNQSYVGIFDMATGTGKTLTGLGAIAELWSEKKRCAVIIVCPYQHLVDQWVEDIQRFNMKPIIGHSASRQKDWKRKLSDQILDYNLGVIDFICFVTTNATFKSDFVQKEIGEIKDSKLLLVDEAHNFGSTGALRTLNASYQYRLALSATLERHNDLEGTEALYNFFGEKCIEYGIDRAIREDKLTPYKYYPVVVTLQADEYEEYIALSKKISKAFSKDDKNNISDYVKMLLIQRSRIIAGAKNKVTKLKELLATEGDHSHVLVYCGATRIQKKNEDSEDNFDERQIVEVSKMIGNELNITNAHFTSKESATEREVILEKFAKADPFKILVAIKCLDEGVNIPSIKKAYILASTTNPKEYIQRRGRVLRKYPGKVFAEIYDFVTLPRPLEEVYYTGEEQSKFDLALVKRETLRIKEFMQISLNPSESEKLINEITQKYNLDLIKEEEDGKY